MPYLPSPDDFIVEDLIGFGQAVRRARRAVGLSQMRLEELTGIDQSMISRLELGRAPAAALWKVVRLANALGTALPFGFCPHDHVCPARTPDSPKPRSIFELMALNRSLRR